MNIFRLLIIGSAVLVFWTGCTETTKDRGDFTPPEVSILKTGGMIEITAFDPHSGVDSITYRIDYNRNGSYEDELESEYTEPLIIDDLALPDGWWSIQASACNGAGLTRSCTQTYYYNDTTPPVIYYVDIDPDPAFTGCEVSFILHGEDPESDIAVYIDPEGDGTYVENSPYTFTEPGPKTVYLKAVSEGGETVTDRHVDVLEYTPCDYLIIVQESIASDLENELQSYIAEIAGDGVSAGILTWEGGTGEELRSILKHYYRSSGIIGAFLIGNFPALWYEQEAFGSFEQFPCDIMLSDMDGVWQDTDGNGVYDSHSSIRTEIFVSRIRGPIAPVQGPEVEDYFGKISLYRQNGSFVDKSSFIFIDEDWQSHYGGYDFRLSGIYSSIDMKYSEEDTGLSDYVDKLSSGGAEFVYQLIHSTYYALAIKGSEGGWFMMYDIPAVNPRAHFYNMFNCSGCRFSVDCLGLGYLTDSDYGLAVHGSTKTGGDYAPEIFYQNLAAGKTWGESFRIWYNSTASGNDEWFLGMVILGDPLLKVSPDTAAVMAVQEKRMDIDVNALTEMMKNTALEEAGETFEEYKQRNPQFFK